MKSVDQFINYLLADKGYSKATASIYQSTLIELWRYIRRTEEKLNWETLDKDVLRNWIAEVADKNISPLTIRKKMSAVRSFYKYLLLTNRITKDPTRWVANPKTKRHLQTTRRFQTAYAF